MLCILMRLPVKSLLRFKSICKPWRELFATPKFIKMHHHQFSNDPKNQAFVIFSVSGDCDCITSLSSISSNTKKTTNLNLPYPISFLKLDLVGCCNGLLCLGSPFSQKILLWNPATRLSKFVSLPNKLIKFGMSLGFGYNAEEGDFKVVCYGGEDGVKVYSAKSDSWTKIEVGFQFMKWQSKNDAIVNGNSYWFAEARENGSFNRSNESLVWCDVTKLEFEMVPLSTLKLEEGADMQFVDWKGSVAALMCSKNEDMVESVVDVWVFNDGEMLWRKNHSFGPVEMRVNRCLQCSKDGKIIGKCLDGKLFLFDPENECVEGIQSNKAAQPYFRVCVYNESLVYIEGMKPMQ